MVFLQLPSVESHHLVRITVTNCMRTSSFYKRLGVCIRERSGQQSILSRGSLKDRGITQTRRAVSGYSATMTVLAERYLGFRSASWCRDPPQEKSSSKIMKDLTIVVVHPLNSSILMKGLCPYDLDHNTTVSSWKISGKEATVARMMMLPRHRKRPSPSQRYTPRAPPAFLHHEPGNDELPA